ncbi:exosome complex component RRP40-like [Anneissia japonica]|uniref:exosome complex component RRP40-like n=1 Tax=Anneissia japonica TaxID=1529436 RepID=UPI0014258668|nr:exosome complex component RRP40-like [Anneissia japonica]
MVEGSMENKNIEGRIVIPGDVVVLKEKGDDSKKIRLGPGLRQESDEVIVCKCGIIRHKKEPEMYWVDCHQKRYVPTKGEFVIGIVLQKAGDTFVVDVGGSVAASLSYLAFEGATKRNRPNVQIGDIVYGRLLVANKDMEPEMVCIDGGGKGDGLGVINRSRGGYMFKCSLGLVRKMLSKECSLLRQLGKHIKFEITIGMNGRIWVHAIKPEETIIIVNAISNAEYMTEDQIKIMVDKLIEALPGF